MSRKAKRYLMLLAAIGLVAVVVGGGSGTFASFNAEVQNPGNTISTGTLFLHDTAGGVTCTSESATNNANLGTGDTCSSIFNASLTSSATTYYQVTLKNAGSLNANDISVYSPTGGCTPSAGSYLSNGTLHTTLSGAQTSFTVDNVVYGMPSGTVLKIGTDTFTTNAVVQPGASVVVHGTGSVTENSGTAVQFKPSFGSGNLCSGLDMEVIETDSSLLPANAAGCAWGTVSGQTCAVDTTVTLASFPTTSGTAHPLVLKSGGGTSNAGTGLDAGGTRYFLIAITPGSSFDNTYQNRAATVDIAWHIDQA